MSDSNTGKYLKIAAAVVLPNIGGYLGSKITRANLKPWYASLNKPKWNPPNFIFAPVWTSIYAGIGYASYLVYENLRGAGNGFDRTAQVALVLYANQMALNWAWTPIFFKYHSLKWVKDLFIFLFIFIGFVCVRVIFRYFIFVGYLMWSVWDT